MKNCFFFLFLLIIVFFCSCSRWFHPYMMYKKTKFTNFTPIDSALKYKEHILTANDEIQLLIYPNRGEFLIDPEITKKRITSSFVGGMGMQQSITPLAKEYYTIHNYRILNDGTVNLPLLGQTKIGGMTLSEAEQYLQNLYSDIFHNPFVLLSVSNKKVFSYMGNKEGVILKFLSPNPLLIEALTELKGPTGKANEIFLIRSTFGKHQVFHLDLSKAENSELGSIVLQSNDVIYIHPTKKIHTKTLETISPYLTLATTLLLLLNLLK